MPIFSRIARTSFEPITPKPTLYKKLCSKIKRIKRSFNRKSRHPPPDNAVIYRLEGGRLRTRAVAPRTTDVTIEDLDVVLDHCLDKLGDNSGEEPPKIKIPKASAELPKELYVIQEEDNSEAGESSTGKTESEVESEVVQSSSDAASSKSVQIAQEIVSPPRANGMPTFELKSFLFVMRVVFTIVSFSMIVLFRARAKAWITHTRNSMVIVLLALLFVVLAVVATLQIPKLLL
ncbi:hypothetical protein FRC03_011488 [Tulasnella sp. 419]|nr:hypothetical protein FRC03_011488 [Tulasnella sp. 419]